MERGFGADFSAVRVHTDSQAAPELGALAFATGRDIHFAPGTYRPHSDDGGRLIAHELAHVVQQGAGTELVRRQIADPAAIEDLERFYRAECLKLGLSPDDPACLEKKQNQINMWDDGDIGLAKTMLGSDLVMLANTGGHSSVGKGIKPDLTKSEALAKNQVEQDRFRRLISEGAASKPTDEAGIRWRNTCQWIMQRRKNIEIYSVTLAHDTDDRAGGGGSLGWFFPDENLAGKDVFTTAHHDYPDKLEDTTNLNLGETMGTEAGTYEGKVIFYSSDRLSDEHIKRTLVHELQHVADRSADAVAYWESNNNFIEVCTARYKTEYRAHWYEGTFDNTPTDLVQELGYEWTARQWEIFQKVYDGYPHTKLAWDFSAVSDWKPTQAEQTVEAQHQPLAFDDYTNPHADPATLDRIDLVRSLIVGYQHPDDDGANKFNSVAIDEFYDAVDKDWTAQPQTEWDALQLAWAALDDEERAFIHTSQEYDRFRAAIATLKP